MDEMVIAIKRLKDGKELGGDEIPAEVWEYREPICPTESPINHQNIAGMPCIARRYPGNMSA